MCAESKELINFEDCTAPLADLGLGAYVHSSYISWMLIQVFYYVNY